MKQNYQKMLESEIDQIVKSGQKRRLLLHACCAPCSSYVLEYLNQYFDITVLFYNPNISPASEFSMRADELNRLVQQMTFKNAVSVLVSRYDPLEFAAIAKGREHLPEGGERCTECFRLRLSESARVAKEGNFDYLTTTLSISPLKDAQRLNSIGAELSAEYGVPYLYSDFKKKEGYKRSIELSKVYDLYRQDYCGCIYSKIEAEKRQKET